MLSVVAITAAFTLVDSADRWCLPPLIARRDGAPLEVASEAELRYAALWDVELTIEAKPIDAAGRLLLRVSDESGVTVAGGESGSPAVACHLHAGQNITVHVTGRGTLASKEQPDFATWIASKSLFAPPPPGPDLEAALVTARTHFDAARAARSTGQRNAALDSIDAMFTAVTSGSGFRDDPEAIGMCAMIATAAADLGALPLALEARSCVVDLRARTLREDDPQLLRACEDLGAAQLLADDLSHARAAFEQVLRLRERLLPADDPALLDTRGNLASALRGLGESRASRALLASVITAWERTLPPGHPKLQWAWNNLANLDLAAGDLEGARSWFERVVAAREATLPADAPELQAARNDLADMLRLLGQLAAARSLLERALAVLERTVPDDDPNLQIVRCTLALTLSDMGDVPAARALQERTLTLLERTRPEDDIDLQAARHNLAITLGNAGDFESARKLQERIVAVAERSSRAKPLELQTVRLNLAVTLRRLDDFAGARALFEKVATESGRAFPADHPALVVARGDLAEILRESGELDRAQSLEQEVLAALERRLPQGHAELHLAHAARAQTLAALGRTKELEAELSALAAGLRAELVLVRGRANREVRETISSQMKHIDLLLSLAPLCPASGRLDVELCGLVESQRALAAGECGMTAAQRGDPAFQPRMDRLRELRDEVARLVATAGDADAFHAAVRMRDAAEAELRSALGAPAPADVAVASIARALPKGSAAIGYRGYQHWRLDPKHLGRLEATGELLAYVVRPDATLTRVELGPIAAVEELVEHWRDTVGKPLERGAQLVAPASDDEAAAGRTLRERVVDPVLAATAGARLLFVALDDVLHLVPLDALPLEAGVVGDTDALRLEVSFARLVGARRPAPTAVAFVAFGGIDFYATPGAATREAAPPDPVAAERSGPGGLSFGPLRQTRFEVESLAELFPGSD